VELTTGETIGAILPGLATGLGGLGLLALRRPGPRTLDTLLGITAGVTSAAWRSRPGAMIYVVDELIPEAHAHGNERLSTLGFTGGFMVMLVLDNALG
jgi:zinc transporter, ZIP family